jgi:hypothetical protein
VADVEIRAFGWRFLAVFEKPKAAKPDEVEINNTAAHIEQSGDWVPTFGLRWTAEE